MKKVLLFPVLVVSWVALFIVGAQLFPVPLPASAAPPEPGQGALWGMLGCAVIDTAMLAWFAAHTRLRGWQRWAALAWAFYGVKTLTSQLEALWFMPNVMGNMAGALFAMMAPLALVQPVLVIAVYGAREPVGGPAWVAPPVTRGRDVLEWAALSALVYPALFWSAGYFIAFRSEAVRAFYGGLQGDGFFGHLAGVFRADPWVVPFEAARGALWILFVLPLFRTSTAKWWVDALAVGLLLALVQNDVHLMPNPLMTAEIRLAHFIETASSNFVWGVVLVTVLRGVRERSAGVTRPPPLDAPHHVGLAGG